MSTTVLTVPAFSFRRIETPFERRPGYRNYLAVVNARDLPDLTDWREINVRDAKERGRVPEKIRGAFNDSPEEFVFMNRGLVIAAHRADYDEHQKSVKLTMLDPEIHGLLDGGHTYRVVKAAAERLREGEAPRFVRIEIITGFDRETISDVVEARNTSNQVRDESLANLRQEFEPLKAVLKDQDYFPQIAWSEYEEMEGEPKPIDVRDIISFLITFDCTTFKKPTEQPLIAYKDKRACLRHFQDNKTRIRKLYPLLPTILQLWDTIHLHWPRWYNEGRESEAGIRGRFGKLTAVTPSKQRLHFLQQDAEYRMPDAYKYPILSATRAAVQVQGYKASWVTDPIELLERAGEGLTNIVGNQIRTTNNPNKVGKDAGIWSSCYLVAGDALKQSVSDEKDRKIQELQQKVKQLTLQMRA